MRLSIITAALPLVFAAPAAEMAPLMVPPSAEIIDGKYIVKFKDGSTIGVMDAAQSTVNVDHLFNDVFPGFAATMSPEELEVEYIEQDSVVSINSFVQQPGAPWGLSRISHRVSGNDSYFYPPSAGAGVCVYVVDTGIEDTHQEFEGRATQLESFVSGKYDGHGHGTHCAGTVGSKTYGVAKNATLYGVKVLENDGSGSIMSVIAGLDFVVKQLSNTKCPGGIVLSLSLGGQYSISLNKAAWAVANAGIAIFAAAGNAAMDAIKTSPASEPAVCTVGAMNKFDQKSWYSNYGGSIDVFAPGDHTLSTWIDGRTNIISGTSMATPHAAGVAACFMGMAVADGRNVCSYIKDKATKNALSNIPAGTINLLLHNGAHE